MAQFFELSAEELELVAGGGGHTISASGGRSTPPPADTLEPTATLESGN